MNEKWKGYRCRLCHSRDTSLFYTGGKASGYRDFLRCSRCDLIFVPDDYFLPEDQEKSRYLQHNNDVKDPAYRNFLAKLYDELKPQLQSRARGLDYGAGPGPALAMMMKEDGFEVSIYDPFFFPDRSVLLRTYDFITCTETAEHFQNPAAEFDRLNDLLRSGGWLGLMTGMLDNREDFPEWYYHRDPTHICFYSQKTMSFLAHKYSWAVSLPRDNVVLFRKSKTG